MRLRKWGFPVLKISGGLPDPIHPLDDPDETPEPDTAPDGRAGMSPPVDTETVQRLRDGLEAWAPDGPPVTERLDVEPERRPWDDFEAPPRQAAPRPGTRLVKAPHCDGRHGSAIDQVDRRRCEYCDALTDAISLVRSLEGRMAELEERVADLLAQADRHDEYEREMRERQS